MVNATLARMGGIALSRLLRPFLWLLWLALVSLVL
jgi:hypothetical protein